MLIPLKGQRYGRPANRLDVFVCKLMAVEYRNEIQFSIAAGALSRISILNFAGASSYSSKSGHPSFLADLERCRSL
jgi:hypothetical protein